MRTRFLPLVVLSLVILGPACGAGGDNGVGPSPPADRLVLTTRPPATPRNREIFSPQPVIQLRAVGGKDIAKGGVTVSVALVGSTGALLGTATAVTDSTGRARFTDLALAGKTGTRQLVFQSVGLIPDSTAVVTLIGGAPAAIKPVTSLSQAGVVGQTVVAAPAVKLTDLDTNVVSGSAVTFRVLQGGGSLAAASVITGSNGIAAQGRWTLGVQLGRNALVAEYVTAGLTLADTFVATAAAGPARRMIQVAGAGQVIPLNSTVPIPPSVQVTDSFGNPVARVPVTFLLGSYYDSIAGAQQVTDSAGIATVGSWKVSTRAGAQFLLASVANASFGPIALYVTVLPGPVIGMNQLFTCGGDLGAPAGYEFKNCLFLPYDAYSNSLTDSPIHFAVTAGGGTLLTPDTLTNGSGWGTLDSWTLGPSPGLNELTVTAGGFNYVLQTQTHLGRTLTIMQGDSQAVRAGTVAGTPLEVRVTDSSGLPVSGVLIAFHEARSTNLDGSLAGIGTVPTNSAGLATAPAWTVGTSSYFDSRMTAAGLGLAGSPATFTALIQADTPHNYVVLNTPLDGEFVALPAGPPVAQVVDQYGNGVPGLPLTWRVLGPRGSLAGVDSVTDSLGIGRVAAWTYDTAVGLNQLVVTTTALPGDSVLFHSITRAGPADTVIVVAGDSQTAPTRHLLPVWPRVRTTDRLGHGMPGEGLTLTVTSGSGSLGQTVATLDSLGETTVRWFLGPPAGLQTVALRDQSMGRSGKILAFGTAAPPAAITPLNTPALSSAAGSALPVPLGALVTDSLGLGVAGVMVHYAVTAGGGFLPVDSAVTDTGGIARVRGWQLAQGSNALDASVNGVPQAANLSATGLAPGSAFNIDVTYIGSPPGGATQGAFITAVARWQRVITGDIPDATINLATDACVTGQPSFSGTIDDLRLYVQITAIDGPGGILGGTGVCVRRNGSLFPTCLLYTSPSPRD